jgi:F-type H+-transporting ATPase subunit epsilon
MMSALDTGVLRFKEDGKWKPVVVMGGFATVDSNQLSVLVNDFEKADSIETWKKLVEVDGF